MPKAPSNVQLLLSSLLNERHALMAPELDETAFFELLTAAELLKKHDLSLDELQEGLIGGGMDGGIDGFYVLVGGDPLSEAHAKLVGRDTSVEVLIFQSKVSKSFSGTALDKLISTISTLFDLGRDMKNLRKLYDEELADRVDQFRRFYINNIGSIGNMSIHVRYVTQGDEPHAAFAPQVDTIESTCRRLFPSARSDFRFVGAPELLDSLRAPTPDWHELELAEDPLVTSGERGYIALSRLQEFAKFVTDESGSRRRRLFLSNVRDYEGDNQVNTAILNTLSDPTTDDFWMLNNGVTILADEVRQAYRKLVLKEPKIVNGLQTSTALIQHASDHALDDDLRSIMIRVVVPKDSAARDRIIVATNSQTAIKRSVLRAAEAVHADIEDLFRGSELVYERRRNSYRNEGVALERIVTIPQLARAVAAILLQKPYLSAKVNSQSRLVDSDRLYPEIFPGTFPLDAYLACARIAKRVESLIGQASLDEDFDIPHGRRRKPLVWFTQWHVAMLVAVAETDDREVTPQSLAALDVRGVPASKLEAVTRWTNEYFTTARRDYRRTVYQLTKSEALTKGLLRDWITQHAR